MGEIYCDDCKIKFKLTKQNVWWDESGLTSVKVCQCPKCKRIKVLRYKELEDINKDQRYYEY